MKFLPPPRPHFSTLIFGALMATAVLCWNSRAVAEPPPPSEPEVWGKVYHCKPGPWGDLAYYYIYLEMPDRLMKLFSLPEPVTRWSFPGATEASVRSLFEKAGLPKALQDALLTPEHRLVQGNVVTVFPPTADLMAMTSSQRSIIYRELAKSEFNPYHVDPICIANGDVETWFAHSTLRPELRQVVKKLTYWRGEMLCFSDVAAVIAMATSEEEARKDFKAMSRTRSLVLRLNTGARSDLTQVAQYWSGNNRNEEIGPMLLSEMETQGTKRLDCIHLLPPLARRYLYCYPSEEFSVPPDCHWTSLNFFNSAPIAYQPDVRLFAMYLQKDYVPVGLPYTFGDVLVYFTPAGEALHSCVYIADDFVYTKNGQSAAAPWLLMKMRDVERFYSYDQHLTLRGYRLKS
jgi:hypothetical protein